MTPKKLTTRRGDAAEARGRGHIAEKYLEVAQLVATEDGTAVNVCVGLCVLAGIAAGDSICLAATGERYSGTDHAAAGELLARVDATAGKHLRTLVGLKPPSHYGTALLTVRDRAAAISAAAALVQEASHRTV